MTRKIVFRSILFISLLLLVAGFVFTQPQKTQAQSWVLQWSDEFNGAANSGVDTNNWKYDTGTGIFGTGEIETMTNSTANVYQDGAGHLVLKAIGSGSNWTSGRIETQRSDFQPPAGGIMRVESSIQQPNLSGAAAAGYWPAFWMLGSTLRTGGVWPDVGEWDVLEDINGRSSVFGTLHCGVNPGGPCNESTGIGSGERACAGCQTGFHTYAIEYDTSVSPEQLRWYLDGANYFTINANQLDATTWNHATHRGNFLIYDLAMGGGFPGAFGGGPTGSTASGGMLIADYVRVYYSGGGNPPPPTNPPTGDGNPYSGSPINIPGRVEAENYNTGGEGVAYHDLEAANQGGQYRPNEGVDIEATTDAGGGYDVGWTGRDEWEKYTVNVANSGTYNLDFRVASAQTGSSLHLEFDGANLTNDLIVPNTGGWQNWTDVTFNGVNLSAGQHVMRFYVDNAGFNINWFSVSAVSAPPPTPTFVPPTPPPSGGDYSQGVSGVNSSTAKVWFKSNVNSAWVDIHYNINGGAQQNFRMTFNSSTGNWEQSISGLASGNVINYSFTYEKSGPAYDTPWFSSTFGGSTTLFSTSLESGQTQPTWTNTVETQNGGINNVGGICCGLTGPELGTRAEAGHTGSSALMYSGADNSASSSFAYMEVFSVNIPVTSTTSLSYWIYPQSPATSGLVSGNNSSCVAIDMVFTDGSNLRDSGVTDQHGNRLHPGSQCGHLTMDAWNNVIANLGSLSGKTIARINVAYDQPANTGGYRGYVDDISITK